MRADYSNYGAAFPQATKERKKEATNRLNPGTILFCLIGPLVTFVLVDGTVSFSIHYDNPSLCWLIVALLFVGVLLCYVFAYKAIKSRMKHQGLGKDPTWYSFLAITTTIAWVAGILHGNTNYWNYIQMYNDVQTLSQFPNVNVSTSRGQQLMDAGRVVFAEGTTVDTEKSMGFKNLEEYCVAPIVSNGSMEVYDFWAVGMNCCSGVGGDFHCGDINNVRAHSGLRLIPEDQRPFYRLAVQQAESTFGIRSQHPLFFYWTQDATMSMEQYETDAWQSYTFGVLSFFFLQLFMLLLALCIFAKLSGASV